MYIYTYRQAERQTYEAAREARRHRSAGPVQQFGHEQRHQHRDRRQEPTKSRVSPIGSYARPECQRRDLPLSARAYTSQRTVRRRCTRCATSSYLAYMLTDGQIQSVSIPCAKRAGARTHCLLIRAHSMSDDRPLRAAGHGRYYVRCDSRARVATQSLIHDHSRV